MIAVEVEKPVEYKTITVDFDALRDKAVDELTKEENDAILARVLGQIKNRQWISLEEYKADFRRKHPRAAAV